MSVNAKLVIVSTLVLYTTPVRVLIVIAIDRMHAYVNTSLHAMQIAASCQQLIDFQF